MYAHSTLTTLAEYSSVPIISGLCDRYHPLQILADFQTIQVSEFSALKMLYTLYIYAGVVMSLSFAKRIKLQ